jgi:hypothetical protein
MDESHARRCGGRQRVATGLWFPVAIPVKNSGRLFRTWSYTDVISVARQTTGERVFANSKASRMPSGCVAITPIALPSRKNPQSL